MKLALDVGVKKLWLEGESNNIIRCIKGDLHLAWTITNIIEEICTKLGKFECIHVSHEYREANSVANWFTNEAVKKDMVMIWNTGGNILVVAKILINRERIQGDMGAILS